MLTHRGKCPLVRTEDRGGRGRGQLRDLLERQTRPDAQNQHLAVRFTQRTQRGMYIRRIGQSIGCGSKEGGFLRSIEPVSAAAFTHPKAVDGQVADDSEEPGACVDGSEMNGAAIGKHELDQSLLKQVFGFGVGDPGAGVEQQRWRARSEQPAKVGRRLVIRRS